ncbi:MAG: hypothetical protein EOP87_16475, partial [Verrucomicrobiaceae bacterium]
ARVVPVCHGGVSSSDKIVSPYSDASGNAFVNVMDNDNNNLPTANPGTSEESAGTAVSYFPFSGGFVGGIVSANGAVLAHNLPAGASVSKVGAGLNTVSGLSLSGNLLAFPNGDSGTDIDNVASVRISNGKWIIDTRDNGVGSQDNSFSFVYFPEATPGVYSGGISSTGTLTTFNGELATLGATVTQTADHVEITFGDGTKINPLTSALFLTADSGRDLEAADNIISYEASGNAFRIFTQDLPQLNGTFQPIDLRFVVVPLDLDSSTIPTVPVVSIAATDAVAGEYGADQALAFTVTRSGPTDAPLTVSYGTSGATNGSDFATLSGSIEIPAGEASTVIPVTVLADDLAEGPETLVITLTDAPEYDLATTASASATIADRPLQAFLFANNLTSADGDDDGDGVKNIVEYYMGTEGDDSSSSATVTAVSGGDGTFTARFPHHKAATDVEAIVEWSTDLITWHTSGGSNGSQTATIATQPVSPPEADPETLEAVLTVTGGPAPSGIFLRLKVAP